MQKKLLILNGAHSDIPLIKAGKTLGFYVITAGNRPEMVGHKYADAHVNVDFSDYEAVAEIARELKIDAVCACCNDFGAITAAYVAEQLGLPGHDPFETTLTLHHKDRFKEFAKKHNLRTPRAESFDNEQAAIDYALSLEYPIIVKPIDLTGGKGVNKAFSNEEKIEAVKIAYNTSPHKRIVVERFITGTYHSFSTFFVDKKTRYCFSNNEFSHASPYLISTSGGPATNIDRIGPILVEESEKVARLLNMVDGKLHMQYVVDEKGEPFIIEMSRRCSGDMFHLPVSKALGINTPEWIVKAECGMDCSDCPTDAQQTGFYGYHCIMTPRSGRIKSFQIAPELEEHVYDRFLWFAPGYEITNHLVDKIGILFCTYDSREQMDDMLSRIMSLITFEYED